MSDKQNDNVCLFLCDYTTVMAQPWADAGYLCYCVDIQHPEGETRDGDIIRVGADLHTWLPPRADYAFAFAFPPCTHLAVSGARWFQSKGLGALVEGLALVERCRLILEWTGAPWGLENPVSTISSYWRKPDYSFHPADYAGYPGGAGDTYTKKTCLWTSPDFVMPQRRPLPVTDHRIHTMPPGPERANQRSATPAGFAQAVFHANCPLERAA